MTTTIPAGPLPPWPRGKGDSHLVRSHHSRRMPPKWDREWDSWLSALAETPLEIVIFGHQRVAANWHMTNRVLHEHLVYGIESGSLRYRLLDDARPTVEDIHGPALFWLPPGTHHSFQLGDPNARMQLYFLRWRNEKPVPNKAGPHYLKTSRASLQALALAYEHFRHPGPGSDHILRAQLTTVHAMLLQQQHAMRKPGLTPAQIQALDNLIIDVGPEHLQPADIGDHLNLSRDYCSRQFRLSFGVAPRTWLVLQRLQGAALLLTESTESISDIAQTYRFADVASLSHAFKKEFGSSPTAYRQRYNQHDI